MNHGVGGRHNAREGLALDRVVIEARGVVCERVPVAGAQGERGAGGEGDGPCGAVCAEGASVACELD